LENLSQSTLNRGALPCEAVALIALLLVSAFAPAAVQAQWRFDPSGFFYLNGTSPKGLEDVWYISLSTGTSTGMEAASSSLCTKAGLCFKLGRLNTDWTRAAKDQPLFEFVTDVRDAVRYTFKGRFLDSRVFATTVTDPRTVVAEGELTKHVRGHTTASATVRLTYYARLWEKNDELMFAARRGDLPTVTSLLSRGADARTMGPYAWSTIEYAVESGSAEVVKAVLAAGADVNAEQSKSDYDRTPTHIADEGRTALMHAASKDNSLDIVELLLAAGASVNARDWRGATALRYAMFGSPPVVDALVRAGADVNAADDLGETVLMHVAGSPNPEKERIVRALLAAGANVHTRSKSGATALSIAKLYEHLGIVTILKNAGAFDDMP
jgi:ankyrin repeat protein